MGQLQAHDQAIIGTEGRAVRLPAFAQHSLQFRSRLFIDEQLPRVRPPLFNDRCCLSPDKLRAARAKPAIAPKRQLIRPAVDRAIAAFHGLDAKRVTRAQRANHRGTEQGGEIVAKP